MRTFLLIIHLLVTLVLVGVILLQKSEDGGGLGGTAFMSARGSANFLTRLTGVLAACFLSMSLMLAWFAKRESEHKVSNLIPVALSSSPEKPSADAGNKAVEANSVEEKWPSKALPSAGHSPDQHHHSLPSGAIAPREDVPALPKKANEVSGPNSPQGGFSPSSGQKQSPEIKKEDR